MVVQRTQTVLQQDSDKDWVSLHAGHMQGGAHVPSTGKGRHLRVLQTRKGTVGDHNWEGRGDTGAESRGETSTNRSCSRWISFRRTQSVMGVTSSTAPGRRCRGGGGHTITTSMEQENRLTCPWCAHHQTHMYMHTPTSIHMPSLTCQHVHNCTYTSTNHHGHTHTHTPLHTCTPSQTYTPLYTWKTIHHIHTYIHTITHMHQKPTITQHA